jgi:sporulation protein YlmC with PRC-barrel domain
VPTAQQQPQLRVAPDPLKMEDVSRVKGAAVYGSDNKKLGSVTTMLMEPASKTIDRLVVSDGGILGVGSHFVAIPLQEFAWDEKEAVFRLAINSDELKRMPEWKEQLSQLPAGSMPPPPPVPSRTAPAASGSMPKPIAPTQ